jgi:hypothetical protein
MNNNDLNEIKNKLLEIDTDFLHVEESATKLNEGENSSNDSIKIMKINVETIIDFIKENNINNPQLLKKLHELIENIKTVFELEKRQMTNISTINNSIQKIRSEIEIDKTHLDIARDNALKDMGNQPSVDALKDMGNQPSVDALKDMGNQPSAKELSAITFAGGRKSNKRKKSKRRKTNNKKYGGRKSNKRKTNKRKTKRDEIGDELYMAALVAAAVNFGDSTDTTSDTISDTSDIS